MDPVLSNIGRGGYWLLGSPPWPITADIAEFSLSSTVRYLHHCIGICLETRYFSMSTY